MSTALASRFALALSTIGLVLSGITLAMVIDQPAPAPKEAVPAGHSLDECMRRDQALASDFETLRADLVSVSSSIEELKAMSDRRRVHTELPVETAGGMPADAALEVAADDGTGEFLLRRKLLDEFQGLDSDDRKDALKELADLARWGDPDALELIKQSLADESGGVRARALRELVGLDEANLATYLHQAFGDPSGSVREVVAKELRELPAEEAGPMLVELLSDPDEDVVLEAIKSIDDLEYAEARSSLAEQLQAEDLDVATRAAYALMELGDPNAGASTIERILKHFAEGDVSSRVRDVKRLRRLGAVNQIQRIYESDASLAVREEARDALASLED